MLGVVIRHLVVAPPALAPLLFQEPEDRLPPGKLEGEVGRHAGDKILGLVMNERMDVAKADPQQREEQFLGEGRKLPASTWTEPLRSGGSTA